MLRQPLSRHWRRVVTTLALASALSSAGCERKATVRNQTVAPSSLNYVGSLQADISGGGGGGGLVHTSEGFVGGLPSVEAQNEALPRKIIRNGSLDLLVSDLTSSIEKISSIAVAAGGYVEKSNQSNTGLRSASLTIRVPAGRLDQTIADIKRLATVVERENLEVRDVTREYVDLDARLRNAQAEETQYLQILKRAVTIKDTLDVTEKLSDVRGRIEEMQGEMKLLTTQIDMSSLEISLHSEAEATVAGIHWRPLVQARIAVSEMLSGLADWFDSVVSFIIYLPVIILWLISILVLLVITVRVIRFFWRKFGPKINWRLPWKRPAGLVPGQGTSSPQS